MKQAKQVPGPQAPGPKSARLAKLKDQFVPRGVFTTAPFFMAEGDGASLTDVDGNTYLDFAGGLGVLNVGHAHPQVVDAVVDQAKKFHHGCFHVAMYEGYVTLAQAMARITPGNFPKKTMFANSGAEAVENAVKIARSATQKKGILVFENAFHGRTFLAMTMTSKVRPYKFGFGALAPEIYRVPYAYCYRCPYNCEYPSCDLKCARALAGFFITHADPDEIAALVVEPVQGEGGFIVPPPEFLPEVARICREKGIIFIADEVQSGFGRTGKMFACEHFDLKPDLLTSAKSLAAGLPLSAVTGRTELMDAPGVGGLGGTYGGNPLACAAAHQVIKILQEDGFLTQAAALGDKLMKRLRAIKKSCSLVGDARGLGPMVALELVKDRKSKAPAKEETARVLRQCLQEGLLLLKAGVYDNVIRILVPLVAEPAQIEAGLDILEGALRKVAAQK